MIRDILLWKDFLKLGRDWMSFEHASYSSSLLSLPINKSWRIGLVNDVTISPSI